MTNIHISPLTAPVHYFPLKKSGYDKHSIKLLSIDNPQFFAVLMYATTLLPSQYIGLYPGEEYVISSMTVDMAAVGRRMFLSDKKLERCITYLVSVHAIVKTTQRKSKLYYINPHFYSTFTSGLRDTYNAKLKHMFMPVVV